MKLKSKKTVFYTLAVIAACVILFWPAYAFLTSVDNKTNNLKLGSLNVQIQNLALTKNNQAAQTMMPGDIDLISWTSRNIGTSAALTRHVIDIYWDDVADVNQITEANAEDLLYLYPSTMTDEEIMADYEGTKSKKISIQKIPTEVEKQVNGKTVYGIRYKFNSSTLEGTDGKGISEITSENLSYKILLSPSTSYLYQNKKISADVTVEGMQYTEAGSDNWQTLDNQGI